MSTDSEPPIDLPRLERSLRHPRTLFSATLSVITALMTLLAVIPLFSVLWMLCVRGGARLMQGISLFTELPPAAGMVGGGIGNALLGTLLMVGIAALISVPVGIMAGVYLAEFGRDTRVATLTRTCAKVLTGLPSILAGVFAYIVVVRTTGDFSAVAGGVALSVLMVPIVLLTAEEAYRAVPPRMREAALGMGCTEAQAAWKIVLPTALPGILTGVMLAVARAAGETAPLLFTALFSDFWLSRPLVEGTPSLAVLIYDFSSSPFPNQIEIAWAASLVLVLLVLALNILGQVLSPKKG